MKFTLPQDEVQQGNNHKIKKMSCVLDSHHQSFIVAREIPTSNRFKQCIFCKLELPNVQGRIIWASVVRNYQLVPVSCTHGIHNDDVSFNDNQEFNAITKSGNII
jgi:hypothetical protein